jgi:hypothetical protein
LKQMNISKESSSRIVNDALRVTTLLVETECRSSGPVHDTANILGSLMVSIIEVDGNGDGSMSDCFDVVNFRGNIILLFPCSPSIKVQWIRKQMTKGQTRSFKIARGAGTERVSKMETEKGNFTGRDSRVPMDRVYRKGSGSARVLEDKGGVEREREE